MWFFLFFTIVVCFFLPTFPGTNIDITEDDRSLQLTQYNQPLLSASPGINMKKHENITGDDSLLQITWCSQPWDEPNQICCSDRNYDDQIISDTVLFFSVIFYYYISILQPGLVRFVHDNLCKCCQVCYSPVMTSCISYISTSVCWTHVRYCK